jgi:hypothetical protein
MHCRQRCERFPAFPAFPTEGLVALRNRTPYGLGLIASSDSYASFATGIAASMSRAPSPFRPDASGRTGRARCLRRPFGLGSTMHRAATRGSNATGRYYNSSVLVSRTAVRGHPFRFPDFLGSPRLAGRTGDHALCCQQCFQRQHDTPTGDSPRNGFITILIRPRHL